MMGFNRVILAGNLTRDPQLSYTPSNLTVCEFGMAVNRKWRDKDGNAKEDVCFVEVTTYARQAEVINQYMHKGNAILVEGRLRFSQWTSKEGQKRSKLDVVAENFTFLGGPPTGGGGGGARHPAEQAGGEPPRTEYRPAPEPNAPPMMPEELPAEDPDVPF